VLAHPIEYSFDHGLATIMMINGDRGNPINTEWAETFRAALQQAGADRARVVLVRSRGRHFCTGGDLRVMASAESLPTTLTGMVDALHEIVLALRDTDAIVVGAVNGAAAGAGLALAVACDLIVAGESATFALGYTKVGLTPDGGASLLVRTLGLHTTLRLALLNDTITAHEAQRLGLVARVEPDSNLDVEVERLVVRLLGGSASAQSAAKRLVRNASAHDVEGHLDREAATLIQQADGPDAVEGVSAFVEKRTASFAHPTAPGNAERVG
jgi:2-(1,2-epoxy-1,2-dihydrophenyl)acetyl-CoA isomerase